MALQTYGRTDGDIISPAFSSNKKKCKLVWENTQISNVLQENIKYAELLLGGTLVFLDFSHLMPCKVCKPQRLL